MNGIAGPRSRARLIPYLLALLPVTVDLSKLSGSVKAAAEPPGELLWEMVHSNLPRRGRRAPVGLE